MNECKVTNDADIRPLDLAAWRPVLTSLNLVRFVLIAIWWSLAFSPLLLCGAGAASPWLGKLLALGFEAFGLVLGAIVLIAMALNCAAPAELRMRELARSAFVLTLIGAMAIGMIVLAQWMPGIRMWLNRIVGVPWLPEVLIGVVLLDFIVAVATWIRFLRSVALALRHEILADDCNFYFFLWCFGVWTILFVPLLFLWGTALILETRKRLHDLLK